jgi:hypothetical protein
MAQVSLPSVLGAQMTVEGRAWEIVFFFWGGAVLGFDLRASYLLDRHSISPFL